MSKKEYKDPWYMTEMYKINSARNDVGEAKFHPSLINEIWEEPGYRLKYVNSVKFVNGKPVDFDNRTKKVYDSKVANKYNETRNKKLIDEFNLKHYKTTTPLKDLAYLEAVRDLEVHKRSKNDIFNKISRSFSRGVVGENGEDTGLTMHDVKWEQDLKRREEELLKLKSGTKYEREELKKLREKLKPETKQP